MGEKYLSSNSELLVGNSIEGIDEWLFVLNGESVRDRNPPGVLVVTAFLQVIPSGCVHNEKSSKGTIPENELLNSVRNFLYTCLCSSCIENFVFQYKAYYSFGVKFSGEIYWSLCVVWNFYLFDEFSNHKMRGLPQKERANDVGDEFDEKIRVSI